MKIAFLGDIVGKPGRRIVQQLLPGIIKEQQIDLVVANAENIAGGTGATPALIEELRSYGIQLFTLGNHTWRKREMVAGIDALPHVARPANYTEHAPGKGTAIHKLPDGSLVAVINLIGRIYMEPVNCPFEQVELELKALPREIRIILVDMHAEATSEKAAMAWHLDGRVTAVLGTHTHVPTADERLLPLGTGFITDVGMCGPYNSILGVERKLVIKRLITGMPARWEVANEKAHLCAVILDINSVLGKPNSIERIHLVEA
ncbi:MAG: TIGR00282 family metallophosphoesterase [Candidatus Hydrogenedentes bacterium]|nr:TIGR00282 family metallophosphoesterase [Candidatus Hydrogenedentota bacterium]